MGEFQHQQVAGPRKYIIRRKRGCDGFAQESTTCVDSYPGWNISPEINREMVEIRSQFDGARLDSCG